MLHQFSLISDVSQADHQVAACKLRMTVMDQDASLRLEGLLKDQIAQLQKSRQQQLDRDAAKAASEAALRDSAVKCAQGLVKLNIGGVKYTTSLTTLTIIPDTYFTSVFSGDWELTKTTEGEVFVDRDGEVEFLHCV